MPRDIAEPFCEAIARTDASDRSCAAPARRDSDKALVLRALLKGEGDAATVAKRAGVGIEKAAVILAELACSPLVWMSMAKSRWRFRLSDLGRAKLSH